MHWLSVAPIFKVPAYAEKIIALTEEAKMAANQARETTGTLKIGATESQCTYRLPPIIKEFKQTFPLLTQ